MSDGDGFVAVAYVTYVLYIWLLVLNMILDQSVKSVKYFRDADDWSMFSYCARMFAQLCLKVVIRLVMADAKKLVMGMPVVVLVGMAVVYWLMDVGSGESAVSVPVMVDSKLSYD